MKTRKVLGVVLLTVLATSAFAAGEETLFDAATAKITGAAAIVGGIAASMAMIGAGVMVWGKVKKYFGKAG